MITHSFQGLLTCIPTFCTSFFCIEMVVDTVNFGFVSESQKSDHNTRTQTKVDLGKPSTIREIGIGIDLVTKTKIETYPIIKTKINPVTNIETKTEIETNIGKIKEVVSLANLALGHDL